MGPGNTYTHQVLREALVSLILLNIVQVNDNLPILGPIVPDKSLNVVSRLGSSHRLVGEKVNCLLPGQAQVRDAVDELPLAPQQVNQSEGIHLSFNELDAVHPQHISSGGDQFGAVALVLAVKFI